MAIPIIRASLLLTTATLAVGATLYETNEPFRHWADDVSGRAQAAWIGLKADVQEFRDDINQQHHRRRRAWEERARQWEGAAPAGPWRRGRRRRSRSATAGRDVEVKEEKEEGMTTAREGEEQGIRRRGGRMDGVDPEKVAEGVQSDEAILNHQPQDLRSRASTETIRSAEGEPQQILTPATTRSERVGGDMDDDAESISVVSVNGSGIMTPTSSNGDGIDVAPLSSGARTPTSSSADELIDMNDFRSESGTEGESASELGDERMEDARSVISEVSGVSESSEWSRVDELEHA